MAKKEITAVLRGMNAAQNALVMGAPNFEECLRLLADEIGAYLGEEPERDGVFMGPENTEHEDSGTYGGGEMPSVSRADVLRWAEQRAYDAPMYADGIAELWEDYLNRACMDSETCEVCISSLDVMMLLALAEIAHIADGTATMDSFIELAACAARGGECADG